MMVRTLVPVLTCAVLLLTGCVEVTFNKYPLDESETRDRLQELQIVLPDTHTLVSMTVMPPPGSGSSDYDGVFTSPLPIAPIEVNGAPLAMTPTTCRELHSSPPTTFVDCATLSNLKRGGTYGFDTPVVVSGQLPSGEARIYLLVAGH